MAEKFIEEAFVGNQWDNVLQNIVLNGDRYVVSRRGEAVAVVVPIEMYEQWRKDRDIAFGRFRKAQQKAKLAPEEGERLAVETVKTNLVGE